MLLVLFLLSSVLTTISGQLIYNNIQGHSILTFVLLYYIGSYLKKYPIDINYYFKNLSLNMKRIVFVFLFMLFALLNTFIYHLERDQFVVLFLDINDKRIVDSKLRAAFEFITNKLFELNFRVKLKFNIGVYRLQKHISIDDPAKILYYALDALDALKDLRLAVTSISHYDSEVNKKRFNKNQLITHISESIDHSKLGLTYKQIINLDKNEVFGYMVLLNLDNYEVDSTYLDFVVERRGLRVDLEKYLIWRLLDWLRSRSLLTVSSGNQRWKEE